MVLNRKELVKQIEHVLAPRGYLKRGPAWYRHFPETILVLDLQKSDYGGQFYINLGVTLPELCESEYPAENHCDVRMRLGGAFSDRPYVAKVFDLENATFGNNDREKAIQELIAYGADWLEKFSSKQAIVNQIKQSEDICCHTTLKLKRFLNLPIEG
jgi:hypothetical protein